MLFVIKYLILFKKNYVWGAGPLAPPGFVPAMVGRSYVFNSLNKRNSPHVTLYNIQYYDYTHKKLNLKLKIAPEP